MADIETIYPKPKSGSDHELEWPSREVLSWLKEQISNQESEILIKFTRELDSADVSDLLDNLESNQRIEYVSLLGDDFDYTILTDSQECVRDQIIDELPWDKVASGVRGLEVDDAAYLIEDLNEVEKEALFAEMPEFQRQKLQKTLDYPDDSAGRLMSTDFIAIPQYWTIGQTIDFMRDNEDLPDDFFEIYVIDPSHRLEGRVSLNHILRSKRPALISDIMVEAKYYANVLDDQEEVARQFTRYDLVSAPVCDNDNHIVGVVTIDDVVDVIQEETDEDIRRIVGLGDEEISDNIANTISSRFIWLFINLVTSIIASIVIGLFEATIEQMVALAVLLPIVASMGGNAGTQTMTVTVRALAAKELNTYNTIRIVRREVVVGIFNGIIFAIILGLVAAAWFHQSNGALNYSLGVVIAMAMIVNMITAGLFGILIPLTLERLKIDPAIASSVFVTTVTDVVGFFAFLGLASAWLV